MKKVVIVLMLILTVCIYVCVQTEDNEKKLKEAHISTSEENDIKEVRPFGYVMGESYSAQRRRIELDPTSDIHKRHKLIKSVHMSCNSGYGLYQLVAYSLAIPDSDFLNIDFPNIPKKGKRIYEILKRDLIEKYGQPTKETGKNRLILIWETESYKDVYKITLYPLNPSTSSQREMGMIGSNRCKIEYLFKNERTLRVDKQKREAEEEKVKMEEQRLEAEILKSLEE